MWAKIDDQFFEHPKVLDLSKDAKLLYIAGLTYCAANLTDGYISKAGLRIVAALVDATRDAAAELITAGLWEKKGDGHLVHDYLEYNPSAKEEKQRRKVNSERVAKWRKGRHSAEDGGADSAADADCNTVTQPVTKGVSNALPVPVPVPVPLPVPPTPLPPQGELGGGEGGEDTENQDAESTDLSEPWELPADELLRRFLAAHPEREQELSDALGVAIGPVRSQAAYLRPVILRILSGKEPPKLAPSSVPSDAPVPSGEEGKNFVPRSESRLYKEL